MDDKNDKRDMFLYQSRLLTYIGAFRWADGNRFAMNRDDESKNVFSWDVMDSTFISSVCFSMTTLSEDFPEGSPMEPVAPPI